MMQKEGSEYLSTGRVGQFIAYPLGFTNGFFIFICLMGLVLGGERHKSAKWPLKLMDMAWGGESNK